MSVELEQYLTADMPPIGHTGQMLKSGFRCEDRCRKKCSEKVVELSANIRIGKDSCLSELICGHCDRCEKPRATCESLVVLQANM